MGGCEILVRETAVTRVHGQTPGTTLHTEPPVSTAPVHPPVLDYDDRSRHVLLLLRLGMKIQYDVVPGGDFLQLGGLAFKVLPEF